MAEWINKLRARLKVLLRRQQMEQDLDDEMAFHLALREEKLRDTEVPDATSAARRRFGNVTRLKEDCREAWTFAALERLAADVRIATRLILKNRWAMLAIILSLALGIGSTAAVFNLFDVFVIRSFPVPETHRVVRITSASPSSAIQYLFSNPDFEDLRSRVTSFEGVTSISADQLPQIAVRPGQPRRTALASLVSANFFSTLHIEPAAGRGFRPDEDEVPGRDAVAVISHRLWQREYGGRADVVGQTIQVNSKVFMIIGVAPQSFPGLDPVARADVYLPRTMEGLFGNEIALTDRTIRRVQVVARLKPGVSIDQAREEVSRTGLQIVRDHPETNRGQQMSVYSQLGAKMALSPELFVLAGLFFIATGLVLAIACVNVANLLLSVAPARTREMAIRVAMGAGRGRLIRQMLIESVLVAIAGTFAGVGLAWLCARFLTSIEIFSNLPVSLDVRVDLRVALFTLAVGLAAGIASGIIPALRCSRGNLNNLLKTKDAVATPGKMRVRQVLVVTQVTIAVLVLVMSGFGLEELWLLARVDPGFRVENIVRTAFAANAPNQKSYRQSLERIRTLAGVRAAAAAYPEPFGVGSEGTNVIVEGYSMPPDQSSLPVPTAVVTEGYFEALDIPVLRGRSFDLRDMGENTRAAIINETMATRYWPNRDPLGSSIKTVGASLADKRGITLEIIGLARTARYQEIDEEPIPFLYLPMKQSWSGYGTLFVVTHGDAASYIPSLRRDLNAIDPGAPVYDAGTMSQHVRHQALVFHRLMIQVLSGVGVVGLVLSVLGLYGIVAYSVSLRTHEIGIRMAIGSTRGGVLRLVLAQGLKLGAIGIAAGAIASILLTSFLGAFFRSANSPDPNPNAILVYAIVLPIAFAVTAFACYLPARRASRVDPNEALRCE